LTTDGTRLSTANSILPIDQVPGTLPATRTTHRSPAASPRTNLAGTRASEQVGEGLVGGWRIGQITDPNIRSVESHQTPFGGTGVGSLAQTHKRTIALKQHVTGTTRALGLFVGTVRTVIERHGGLDGTASLDPVATARGVCCDSR
jgi:hypothetical protein